jgi:hypothetical protein
MNLATVVVVNAAFVAAVVAALVYVCRIPHSRSVASA